MKPKLKVGDSLLFVRLRYLRQGGPDVYDVTVTKIGRRWVYLSNDYRIDAETWAADAGEYISPGTCHTSREAYEAALQAEAEWELLKRCVAGHAPEMSAEAIRAMRETIEAAKWGK